MTASHLDLIATDDVLLTRQRDEPNTWHYLPLRPHPQRAPDGTPMASIVEAGEYAFVSLSSQLDPSATEVEAFRTLIATNYPSRAPIVLRTAVERVIDIELSVAGKIVGRSEGSGFAPFSAAFSVTVDGDAATAVRDSFDGVPGRMTFDYVLDTVHGVTRVGADVGTWFTRASDTTHHPDQQEVTPC